MSVTEDDTFLKESLLYKVLTYSLKDVGVYLAGRHCKGFGSLTHTKLKGLDISAFTAQMSVCFNNSIAGCLTLFPGVINRYHSCENKLLQCQATKGKQRESRDAPSILPASSRYDCGPVWKASRWKRGEATSVEFCLDGRIAGHGVNGSQTVSYDAVPEINYRADLLSITALHTAQRWGGFNRHQLAATLRTSSSCSVHRDFQKVLLEIVY